MLIELYFKDNRAMFGLWLIKSCTTQTLRWRLVETLIVPHLDNCGVVYLDVSLELSHTIPVWDTYVVWGEISTSPPSGDALNG